MGHVYRFPPPKPPGGPAGADGKSAYQTWLDAGNAGTEQDFLDSLKGQAKPVFLPSPYMVVERILHSDDVGSYINMDSSMSFSPTAAGVPSNAVALMIDVSAGATCHIFDNTGYSNEAPTANTRVQCVGEVSFPGRATVRSVSWANDRNGNNGSNTTEFTIPNQTTVTFGYSQVVAARWTGGRNYVLYTDPIVGALASSFRVSIVGYWINEDAANIDATTSIFTPAADPAIMGVLPPYKIPIIVEDNIELTWGIGGQFASLADGWEYLRHFVIATGNVRLQMMPTFIGGMQELRPTANSRNIWISGDGTDNSNCKWTITGNYGLLTNVGGPINFGGIEMIGDDTNVAIQLNNDYLRTRIDGGFFYATGTADWGGITIRNCFRAIDVGGSLNVRVVPAYIYNCTIGLALNGGASFVNWMWSTENTIWNDVITTVPAAPEWGAGCGPEGYAAISADSPGAYFIGNVIIRGYHSALKSTIPGSLVRTIRADIRDCVYFTRATNGGRVWHPNVSPDRLILTNVTHNSNISNKVLHTVSTLDADGCEVIDSLIKIGG